MLFKRENQVSTKRIYKTIRRNSRKVLRKDLLKKLSFAKFTIKTPKLAEAIYPLVEMEFLES